MTPQKKPPTKKYAELQSQEIGKPISTHSLKPLDNTETWEVHLGDKRTMFGQTKEEALERAGKYIKEREAQGLWWELKQCWRTERTKPYPMVLIIGSEDKHCGRPADAWVMRFRKVNWFGLILQAHALFFGTQSPSGKTQTMTGMQWTYQKMPF